MSMDDKLSKLSPGWQRFLNGSTFGLSGISLLADVLGLGKLAYDVIIIGDLTDLGFKLIVLLLVFLFGIGLGVVAVKGFDNTRVVDLARIYAWIYIAIACFSYLGIALALRSQDYNFSTYVAFVIVIISQLFAVKAMQIALEENLDIRHFSIPILTVCLVHGVLIVYTYVFATTPASIYLAGDIVFFTGMTLIGSAMLGDIAFRVLLAKIYHEVKRT